MKIRERAEAQLLRGWRQFAAEWPVVAFFLALFYLVILLFGTKYIMTVSLVTVAFKVSYKKNYRWPELFRILLMQIFLCGVAFVATLHISLCLILNFAVPFWLIFTKTSQFNQTAYFSTLMTFTFLQLVPLGVRGYLVQAEALCFGLFLFLLACRLYSRTHSAPAGYRTEQESLETLSAYMKSRLDGKPDREGLRRLYNIQEKLYLAAYQKPGKNEVADTDGKISYLLALTCQRGISLSRRILPAEIGGEGKALGEQLPDYLRRAGQSCFWEKPDREKFLREGESLRADAVRLAARLKDSDEEPETVRKQGEYYADIQTLLRPFLRALNILEEKETGRRKTVWKTPSYQKPVGKLRSQLHLDLFETRFALRMSAALVLSFAYLRVTGADHAYWLPLNTMLLLRPMYEESTYRMKTRFTGTALGCLILSLVLPLMPGTAVRMVLAGVMAACLYSATAGTCVHALYVTCFAMSMVTLAMGTVAALRLRIFYVGAAVILVLVINRFFFPMSLGHQYRYNFQMLFHLQHTYLRLLRRSAAGQVDGGTVCEVEVRYHLIHSQVMHYLEDCGGQDREYARTLMGIAHDMAVCMEQILYFVNTEHRGRGEEQVLGNYVFYADYVMSEVQRMLHLKTDRELKPQEGTRLVRSVEGEPELSALLLRYAKKLSLLFRTVSAHNRGRQDN